MHEASLAMNILDIAKEEMKKYPGSALKTIYIDVGEFTHIDPETLDFAFGIMAADTEDYKGTKLSINKIPLILLCRSCGKEFGSDDLVFKCPCCSSTDIEVSKGREFRITELEVD